MVLSAGRVALSSLLKPNLIAYYKSIDLPDMVLSAGYMALLLSHESKSIADSKPVVRFEFKTCGYAG